MSDARALAALKPDMTAIAEWSLRSASSGATVFARVGRILERDPRALVRAGARHSGRPGVRHRQPERRRLRGKALRRRIHRAAGDADGTRWPGHRPGAGRRASTSAATRSPAWTARSHAEVAVRRQGGGAGFRRGLLSSGQRARAARTARPGDRAAAPRGRARAAWRGRLPQPRQRLPRPRRCGGGARRVSRGGAARSAASPRRTTASA